MSTESESAASTNQHSGTTDTQGPAHGFPVGASQESLVRWVSRLEADPTTAAAALGQFSDRKFTLVFSQIRTLPDRKVCDRFIAVCDKVGMSAYDAALAGMTAVDVGEMTPADLAEFSSRSTPGRFDAFISTLPVPLAEHVHKRLDALPGRGLQQAKQPTSRRDTVAAVVVVATVLMLAAQHAAIASGVSFVLAAAIFAEMANYVPKWVGLHDRPLVSWKQQKKCLAASVRSVVRVYARGAVAVSRHTGSTVRQIRVNRAPTPSHHNVAIKHSYRAGPHR